MLRTKNSNRISQNKNSSSVASGFTPWLFLLLFPVSKTRVGEVPGRAGKGSVRCCWSRAAVAGRGRRRRAGRDPGPVGACGKGAVKGGTDPREDNADAGEPGTKKHQPCCPHLGQVCPLALSSRADSANVPCRAQQWVGTGMDPLFSTFYYSLEIWKKSVLKA